MTKAEMEKGFQEIWDLFRETNKELETRFRETDLRFKETSQELETRFRETDERFRELRKELQESSKKVDALTGKWSKFVEGLVAPATVRLFRERGIEVTGIAQRVKRQHNGAGIEIDILATNTDYVVLIEAKSTLGVDDVNEHLERLERFSAFFPEYRGRKVLGAVAGIEIDDGADKYAYRRGLFVIAQSGDSVQIVNDEKFQPRAW